MIQTLDTETSSPPDARARDDRSALPPAIVLGGEANALSVARSLGRAGVPVYVLNDAATPVCYSRYSRRIPVSTAGGAEDAWARYLLGPESDHLRGAVLLACSDPGIQLIVRHRDALAARFRLDVCDPAAQLCMLDKLSTYQQAVAAGVPTPRFWRAESRAQIESLRDQLVFPLLVKPRLSHVFQERFGRKYVFAERFEQILDAFEEADDACVDVMLVEWIPGPDDRLCSYYTYLDGDGNAHFHFTKRIIRRYPAAMGTACYHVTDWNPEARDIALRLFRHVGLRGLANVEFKRDERDGRLKLIECNARFTASNCLVAASGFDLAAFTYNRITGRPQPPLASYRQGLRLWDPIRDFQSYLELRGSGQLSFRQWLASVLRLQTFPYFSLRDPLPALARASRPLRNALARRWNEPGTRSEQG